MRIAYARVSSTDQNLDRQIEALTQAGFDYIFQEKRSGKNIKDRVEFNKMMASLQPGDVVTVVSFDRLGRNLIDLLHIAEDIKAKGAELVSLKERIDTTNPMGRAFFQFIGIMAQLERDMIRDRQQSGIRVAKANGKSFGRPSKISTPEEIELFRQRIADGETLYTLRAMYGLTKTSLYRAMDKHGFHELYYETPKKKPANENKNNLDKSEHGSS